MDIYPVQVAFRGFQHGISIPRILDCLQQAQHSGRIKQPAFTRWPGGEPILIHLTQNHLKSWKHQHDEGVEIDIPADLWATLDDILGVRAQHSWWSSPASPSSYATE